VFQCRVRMVVYLDGLDLEGMKREAMETGKSVVEWARDVLKGSCKYVSGVPASGLPRTEGVRKDVGRESVAARIDDELEGGHGLPRTKCSHGVARGFRCWQCGGKAKII